MDASRVATGKVTVPHRRVGGQQIARWLGILIGGVFLYAGWAKMRDETSFAESIASFKLLPAMLDNLLAISLPPFEGLLGLWLITGWRPRMASFCAVLTSGVFLLALVQAWGRGISVVCGCFGVEAGTLSPQHQLWFSAGRDTLLLGGALATYITTWKASAKPRR